MHYDHALHNLQAGGPVRQVSLGGHISLPGLPAGMQPYSCYAGARTAQSAWTTSVRSSQTTNCVAKQVPTAAVKLDDEERQRPELRHVYHKLR